MDFRFSISDFRFNAPFSAATCRGLCGARSSKTRSSSCGAQQTLQSQIANHKSQISRRAFTLTELLITIGLIVMLIAMAVPAFRFLTGGRSIEGATNVVAAMLGQARADAIGVQQIRGVAFYREAQTDRVAVTFVSERTVIAYVAGSTLAPITYNKDQYVQLAAKYYVCLVDYTDSGTGGPPSANWREITDAASINNVRAVDGVVLERPADSDRVLLPVGIDLRGAGNNFAGGAGYIEPAVVLFDAYGTLVVRPYRIPTDSDLGRQANKTNWPTAINNTTLPMSQVGLMLFDEESYKNAGDPVAFINENGSPLQVNRYNGTLVKGE